MAVNLAVPRGDLPLVHHEAQHGGRRLSADHTFARQSSTDEPDDEAELRKAALEALQQGVYVEKSKSGRGRRKKEGHMVVLEEEDESGKKSFRQVQARQLSRKEQEHVVRKAMATDDSDNTLFLQRLKERMDRVGIHSSQVEVRFQDLNVETDVFVGSRALPSVSNAFLNYLQAPLDALGLKFGNGKQPFPIIKHMNGVLRPGRMTLLLGPPGSGKSTLLKALAGKLVPDGLRIDGSVTYNGKHFNEFVPQRTAALIEQVDEHIAELTVRETLDFAARVQGVGHKKMEMEQLLAKEREAGIAPDLETDAFIKADALSGARYNVVTEYILRVLGLDYVAETLVGGPMLRGISGGQKKRVTTGEMIVGPKKTLFMDEISTGLDSSTTFQIVQSMANFTHLREGTVLMALLQPAPEVYNLFDEVLLLAEGHIIFHGPKDQVLPFFNSMGFELPERKGIADFLQEVTSPKDQEQYWSRRDEPYKFVPVSAFFEAFQNTKAAQVNKELLVEPYVARPEATDPLVYKKYGLGRGAALRACLRREIILFRRNSFIYVFRTFQVCFNAFLTSTLFFRTTLNSDSLQQANLYLGILFFSLTAMLFNNWAEFAIISERLAVFYKQRDNLFYPSWAFALPTLVLQTPQAMIESVLWSSIVYWVAGLSPQAGRFFTFLLIMFLFHQLAVALFRSIGAIARSHTLANAASSFSTLIFLGTGGYILSKGTMPGWWVWAYWVNPMAWAQQALAINEFRGPRWQKPNPGGPLGRTLGQQMLLDHSFHGGNAWVWAGVGYLFASVVFFNIVINLALAFLSNPETPGGMMSEEALKEKKDVFHGRASVDIRSSRRSLASAALSPRRGSKNLEMAPVSERSLAEHVDINQLSSGGKIDSDNTVVGAQSALPFEQLGMSFSHVWYSVDVPSGADVPPNQRKDDEGKPRLNLLCDVSGAFRPNVLTALVGASGAGKTTLMDVLAGRKTGGKIEGDIRINGFPKEQATFARISGYIEQTDIHSPQTTVWEAMLFSAKLRLPSSVSDAVVSDFVEEIMDVVELTPLRSALVGLPGVPQVLGEEMMDVVELTPLCSAVVGLPGRSGLSVEQRKRLTIAVELVANPSIVFMDEPTSGLDARAAAIVMRTVRNTVDTGRTVVCTIHQPSIDIFEAFDELLLMKRGGRIIYFGPLGERSKDLVQYFEAIDGVPKIEGDHNPATWVLEVSNTSVENRTGLDFADVYEGSQLYKRTEQLLVEMAVPPEGSEALHFETQYARGAWAQYLTLLWKNNKVYWRSPEYNSVRLIFTVLIALFFGTAFWNMGMRRGTRDDIYTIMGALFAATMFLGVYNSSSVQPVIGVERTVFYRERAAGYYAVLPYAIAQGTVELPYILVQSVIYSAIVYSMIGFEWTAAKFFWFLFFEILSLEMFTMFGIFSVSITPNVTVASILSGTIYFTMTLTCGFIIPAPNFPGWWIWLYYLNPVSWILYGQVTSQLGDVTSTFVDVDGTTSTVKQFLSTNFRFEHQLLGLCVGVLFAFILFFRISAALAYKKINFQKR